MVVHLQRPPICAVALTLIAWATCEAAAQPSAQDQCPSQRTAWAATIGVFTAILIVVACGLGWYLINRAPEAHRTKTEQAVIS